jgi:phosphoribosylformylglycinamidine (FGAM) synthase-like enzyme
MTNDEIKKEIMKYQDKIDTSILSGCVSLSKKYKDHIIKLKKLLDT